MIQLLYTQLSSALTQLLGMGKLSREMRKSLLIMFVVIIFVQALVATNMLLLLAVLKAILGARV